MIDYGPAKVKKKKCLKNWHGNGSWAVWLS